MAEITVLGAHGMLGSHLVALLEERGHTVRGISRNTFDVLKQPFADLRPLLSGSSHVINCMAALSSQQKTMNPYDYMKINAHFPLQLGDYSRPLGYQLIQISSDAVFSGTKGDDLIESDDVDPVDLYGLSKSISDHCNGMVLRLSILGKSPRQEKQSSQFLDWVISKKGETVNGYSDSMWNGMTVDTAARAIGDLIDQNQVKPGVVHLHSPKAVSKFALIQMINDVYKLGITVKSSASPQATNRTLRSHLNLARSLIQTNIQDQILEFYRKDKNL